MVVLEKSICDLPGYEAYKNYAIRSNGEVVNKITGRVLSQPICRSTGYRMVCLWGNNSRRTCCVHRLLALAFIDNPTFERDVNHKDGNKTNNRLDNLEWVSHRENIVHAIRNGLFRPTFVKSGYCGKRIVCCEDGNQFNSVKSAAEFYGVVAANISGVLKGKRKTAGGRRFEYAKTNRC